MNYCKVLRHCLTLVCAVVGVIFCAPCSLAASADADNKVSVAEQRENAAEEQYQQGVAAFAQKRYLEAVDRFSRANALRPDSRLYFNIGLAFDRAGDVSNALSNYRSYIFEERTSEHTARVTTRVTELEKELAKSGVQQVTIRSTPTHAAVVIDGKSVGVTPWTGDLEPGFYRVKLSSSGFETSRLEFSLSLKAALTLSSTLDPLPTIAKADGNAKRPQTRPSPVSKPPLGRAPFHDEVATRAPAARSPSVAPWVVLGGGAAAGLAALGFELDRRDAVADAQDANSRRVFEDHVGRMERDQVLARVFGGLAVTSVVVGVVWMLAPNSSREQPGDTAQWMCGVNGCNAGLRF